MALLTGIAEKMTGVIEFLSGQTKITEANIESTLKEVKTILLDADVNLQVTNSIISKVKEKAIGMQVDSKTKPGEQFISLLAKELVEIMGSLQTPLVKRSDGRPSIILLAGLQGAGKTTIAGKLSNYMTKTGLSKKLLLVAGDVYRPAAIDQLQTLGSRLNIDVYTDETGAMNPVQISRNALKKALAEGYDTVIIDTAGRQVVDNRLMEELKSIKSAVSPDETLLVVDAMTGQEAATLTARFNDDIGITGAILTKLDGDTRGGSALSVRGVSGKPIKFIGVGEGMDDLEPFYPDRMASRILGLGDIQTLMEKASQAMSAEESIQQAKKMQKGVFNFNDFLVQTQAMRRMGGLSNFMKQLPGGLASKMKDEDIYNLEQKFKKYESIIGAMSDEERTQPELVTTLGGKKELVQSALLRRKEIARKTELLLTDVDGFISEFNSMRRMMVQQFKGADLDADPNAPMQQKLSDNGGGKSKKVKATRGGGGGFGAK